ncbi:pilin [Streptomyces sp. DSM 44915]|uniref:Pilin n=1 Tax=Streptomyces chisholmiae TaxID=3075540 RepID=A0ABU2JQH7_9ACTN|nr:pilin [Streptomyces sp. DSM 44915]MDT0267230.1 pilin [Streptomyces sp. DSM 44915]
MCCSRSSAMCWRHRLALAVPVAGVWVVTVGVGLARAAEASLEAVVTNLITWIAGIVALLATLFLTVGGLRYLMAGGDPGEVESAKRALRAAAIGYGIVVLAPVLVAVLRGIVGDE